MVIFTVREENTPKEYDNYLENIKNVYTDIIVLSYIKEHSTTQMSANLARVKALAEQWLDQDVLYVDMDCIAGAKKFDGSGYTKPAFYNCLGGYLENCVIYKPVGQHAFFEKLLKNNLWQSVIFQYAINSELKNSVETINGYPDFEYFKHNFTRKI